MTPLGVAAANGWSQVVELLLKAGAGPNGSLVAGSAGTPPLLMPPFVTVHRSHNEEAASLRGFRCGASGNKKGFVTNPVVCTQHRADLIEHLRRLCGGTTPG